MKNPGVAFFAFTKSVTRWIRFASGCVIIAGRGFFAGLGVVVADLLAGRGGLALVSALSGQRKSKSSDAVLRFVSTGRFVGDTFVFTWPVAASEGVISNNNSEPEHLWTPHLVKASLFIVHVKWFCSCEA